MKSFDLEVIPITSTHCPVARTYHMTSLLSFKEMGKFNPSMCQEREENSVGEHWISPIQ